MLKLNNEAFEEKIIFRRDLDKAIEIVKDGDESGVPIKVLKIPGEEDSINSVVFFFHGAVNREKRKLPVFEGSFVCKENIPGCLLISISDPTLKVNDQLSTTWYAGTSKIDLPSLISEFVEHLLKAISPERVVFTGGSVGGYPALFHASKVDDSIVILKNPILNIGLYFVEHRKKYAESAWGTDFEKLNEFVTLDSFEYLKCGRKINLIYVQGATDHHFWKQAVSFLENAKGLDSSIRSDTLFISSHFTGYKGHKFPAHQWSKWIQAACLSEKTNVVNIAECFNDFCEDAPPKKTIVSFEGEDRAHDNECAIQEKLAKL